MKKWFFAFIFIFGCAPSPDDDDGIKHQEPTVCGVVEVPMYVPLDGSYLVEASYGTVPISCPCDVGGGSSPVACPYGSHPTETVVRAFPLGGPKAEAVYSFVLGPGQCYEHVACVTNADPPILTRL